jgi:putative ABC transport system permease protein
MMAVGRLKPGVSVEAARAEMNGIAAGLERRWPAFDTNWGVTLVPLAEQLVGDVRRPLWLLLGAVGFVLLIACANVANLSLARATARRKEVALRAALGAGRARIVRQLMTESLLLSAIGGGAGLALATWGVDALLALSPPDLLGLEGVGLDGRVVAFTVAVAVLTSAVFGLAPAFETMRVDPNEAIREGASRTSTDARGRRVRDLFVVAQVALTLVLLVGSGLLVRSLSRLQSVDPGFDAARVLTMQVKLPGAAYQEDAKVISFYRDALEKVRAVPGVRSASAINFLPFNGLGAATDFTIEGAPPPPPGHDLVTEVRVVDPAYFSTMGIPLVSGRTFTEGETRETGGVVVVSESFARRYFPGEDPIGKRVLIDMKDEPAPTTIVGVVGDVRLLSFDVEPRPTAYWPIAELPYSFMTVVARTDVDPLGVAATATREIASLDPEVPVSGVLSMEERLSESVSRSRFGALLLAIFAGVALLIAVVGIYGVVAYTVAQRTQEIGIRMALGATHADVLRMVLAGGLLPTAAGIALGVVASFGLARLMSSLLFGVTATDPATYATLAAALAATALLACMLPARRAAAVEPVEALRHE